MLRAAVSPGRRGLRPRRRASRSAEATPERRVGSSFDARAGRARRAEKARAAPDFDVDGDAEVAAQIVALRRAEGEVLPAPPEVLFSPALQPAVQPGMRAKVVGWLSEVCLHLRLRRATLYLAVHYLDVYLSRRRGVPVAALQLLGVSALLVAAKAEEIHAPKTSALSAMCAGACPPAEMLDMELALLDALEWRLFAPTTHLWLGLFAQRLRCAWPHDAVAAFVRGATALLDLALHVPRHTAQAYSLLAASALHLQHGDADATAALSGYGAHEFGPVCAWLAALMGAPAVVVLEAGDAAWVLPGARHDDALEAAASSNARVVDHLVAEIGAGRI